MKPARIAFVIMDVAPVGGMERQATEVLRGLVADGHDVTVIARTCELDDATGIRFVRVRAPQRPFSLAFPIWIVRASAAVARLDADLVHVNGAIVLNRADVATIHFCHRAYQAGFALAERSGPGLARRLNTMAVSVMVRAMEAWCLRPSRTRQLVGISTGVAHEVERWFPRRRDRPEVIPYGVDSERFKPSAEERTRVRGSLGLAGGTLLAVFVGGEWERKGLRHVIEALGASRAWHLVVAGTGDREHYEQLAAGYGAGERVHFVGKVDPAGFYAAGDAFVFPTAYETFSLVVHEAAAAALPLVVTEVSGPDELVQPGVNGWFVSRSSDEIAAKLALLESDRPAARAMGAAARDAAVQLTWDRARAAHSALYTRLLAGRASP